MSYASRALESKYSWDERGNLNVENAVIFWTNFKGEPTRFNPQGGKRTLNLALHPDIAEEMRKDGWNVKTREPYDEQDDILYHTECVLNMNSQYEPRVLLCSEWNGKRSMTRLHKDNVGMLDDIRYANVDLIVHPHVHENGRKGYVNTIVVTQAKSDLFGGKYDDYDLRDSAPNMGGDEDEDLPF